VGVVLIFLGFLVSIEVFSDLRLPFTRIVMRRRMDEPASEPVVPRGTAARATDNPG
jgi:hypothetical protein